MRKIFTSISTAAAFIIILIMCGNKGYAQEAGRYEIKLEKNWTIQSSSEVKTDGADISSADFNDSGWYAAEVPSTVLGALVNDGVYNNIFYAKNLDSISTERFDVPWWFRTQFKIPAGQDISTVKLDFEGINYRADIWLNGKLIASSDAAYGSFRTFSFDVTNEAKIGGENILAVKVTPPVKGEPTIGFVDWDPKAPDHNMGLWRPVTVRFSGDVSINNPFVKTKVNTVTLKEAWLSVSSEIQNNSGNPVKGKLTGKIGEITFSKNIALLPHENRLIEFNSTGFPQLDIKNPRLWWTHDFGKPELYSLKLSFTENGKVSDEKNFKFGIRQVSDYINKDGFRGFKLNGKKILIRGGGWSDHLLLDNSKENLKAQINYAVQMNLNAIRMEGFWGEGQEIFNLCDQKGILIMAGWSCQWEWENLIGKPVDEKYGGIMSQHDMDLISASWKDQIKWLRNHPSIFLWLYGSDKYPNPELEKRYLKILEQDDPTRPSVASAKEWHSTVTGNTAVKMRGPYDYVPPDYWYVDKKLGGAFGFNTETGPGPQVSPIESLRKMIPADSLWPMNNGEWIYHASRGMFRNFKTYNRAIDKRLGKPVSLEDYERKAQLTNYDAMRAMFEAFCANKFVSTGVIQWMYNSAWPKLWWQFYDYYLMPNGAFYGARKAGEPLHLSYNYADNSIDAVNNSLSDVTGYSAKIIIVNFDMSDKYSKTMNVDFPANKAYQLLRLPEIEGLSKTYFVDLKLLDKNKKVVGTNFYALSTQKDILDTAKATWYVTYEKQYADLTELNSLPEVSINVKHNFTEESGREKVKAEITNNTKNLAFMVRLAVTKGKGDDVVLPIFWGDNYFSLLPGEKRVVEGYFYKKDLEGKTPELRVTGWNIK